MASLNPSLHKPLQPPASPGASARSPYDWSHLGLPNREVQLQRTFTPSVLSVIAIVLGLFYGLVRYTEMGDNMQEEVEQYYMVFIDVQIMIFIGFGFLMTFMRRYSYGAVALNYFASALMMLEAILMIGACQQVLWNENHTKISLDMPLLIDAAFCAGSGMIAFGAIIGKATPTQLMWLCFFQVPFYAFNQQLVIHTFKALDMGGTLVIHLFGAYYGLSASLMISRRQPLHGVEHPKNTGSYLNDVFSMIGTIFLWIYWPSFNGALASVSAHDQEHATTAEKSAQFLSMVNTLLSLLGAVLSVFCTSALVGKKLNMVHIQNSTLAGGVAMGAACTLRMTPGGAMTVGVGAGFISTLGFQYLTPFLDRKIGLGDTCGVHNLHGIPAIIGSLVAGLASLGQHSDYLEHDNGKTQLGYQVLATVVTMGIALASGTVFGYLVTFFNPTKEEPMMVTELFDDGPWWHDQKCEPLPYAASQHLMNASRHSYKGNDTTTGRPLTTVTEGPEARGAVAISGEPVQHVVDGQNVPLFMHGMTIENAVQPVQPVAPVRIVSAEVQVQMSHQQTVPAGDAQV